MMEPKTCFKRLETSSARNPAHFAHMGRGAEAACARFRIQITHCRE